MSEPAASETTSPAPVAADSGRMPTIFLAHGSPATVADGDWMGQLNQWARNMPRPRAVLMISAHWEERPFTIGATTPQPLIYDFYGFPEEFYRLQYASPGAPELAQRVRELVGQTQPVAEEPERGLDHGAYVPLMAMYPEADVPVLQVSLPTLSAPALFDLGRQLAPLREEGVLIVGSGFLTHNLRLMDRRPGAITPEWAKEFDHWAEEALASCDVDAMVEYERRAPAVDWALPTREHFVPAVVTLGSAVDSPGEVSFPITGWLGGAMTKRSVQYG
jgi:4,5-DOPA dioxygenase extradiol